MSELPDLDSESSAIWHILLDSDIADEAQLLEVWEEHERTGLTFQQAIYNYGLIGETELLQKIAESIGTEFIDVKGLEIDPELTIPC